MCGVAGVVGDNLSPGAIQSMVGALKHRGPDGYGIHEADHVQLGHTRLSIIDLDGGKQPILSDDGKLVLICNGEIYNSPALRSTYQAKGYRFSTRTDVEVILPLYQEHGPNCVTYLRGMFAFAIWDSDSKELFLARDHMGQKPIFFSKTAGGLLFASEPKAILASKLLTPALDLDAIWHYMSLRFIPDDRSMFAGINKLEAGTTLRYAYASGHLTTNSYWRPAFEPKFDLAEPQLTDQLDATLMGAVESHLLSDVPVGAFLSGGIDSGTVSAMMATLSPTPVPTFTLGTQDQSFDETPYARQVIDRYAMQGHIQEIDANLIDLTPAMIRAMDEPADPFGAGVYLVSKLAKQHVKVVLSGDGGDESFAGYDRYSGQRLVDYYCWLPAWFRKSIVARLSELIPESFAYKSLAQKAAWMNAMSLRSGGERYVESMSFLRFTHERKQQLWTPDAIAQLQEPDSSSKILDFFESESVAHVVDKMLYTDMMTRLPDHLLAVSDRMSMAHSLEARPVMVDREFVSFAARLPAKYKLKGTQLKYLLRKVAARYLPRELVYRPKQGFSFPIGRWLREDLRTFTGRLLAESRFVELGIFSREHIDGMFREHIEGKMDHNYRLWMLINFEFWYRMYFEGASVEDLQELTRRYL